MFSRLSGLVSWLDRPRAGQLLVACGFGIGLILAAAVAYHIVTSRQGAIDDAAREMRNDALMLAEQEDRLLQAADVVQLGLIDHMRELGIDSPEQFERLMATRDARQNLSDRIAGLTYITALSLSDRHGVLLNFSGAWPAPAINAADRDFIRELSSPGAPRSFISQPSRSEITGQWTMFLSRRFDAADGTLIGFVISTIQISYFERFYARLPLTGDGAFALLRRDGMLIARYPRVDPKIGESYAETTNFNRMLASLDHGMVRQTSFVDGQDRLLVPRAMEHFPLIVTVSDTMKSILRAWRQQLRMLITTTAMLELGIAGTMLLLVRQLGGRERLRLAETARANAEAGLTLAEEREQTARTLHLRDRRFDMAVQNMAQGLIMVDHAGRVLVVNRRLCEFTGVPMEAIPPGTGYDKLLKLTIAAGQSTEQDMLQLRRSREQLIGRGERASFIWERADGRSFTVTHQPMDEGWLTTYEEITDRRAAEARIAHLAHHDALTGLPNRVLFRETLDHALAFARRGHLLALHCLDLDQFKAVNDTLGHPVGDELLRAVAERLGHALRETDAVARLGGDEFAIVQTAIGSPLEATELAARLIALIEAPFEIDGHQIVIGTSIGIAFSPGDAPDADQLLKCADLALYRAKADGRGVYRLFQAEMDAAMQARRILEMDLRQALAGGQLELFYQPQIDVGSRRIAGCEALLRWRHPTKGLVPPGGFIALAEETGMIVPIGAWVLRQACIAAAGWPDALKVAVNVSAVQVRSHGLLAAVTGALRESGLHPSRLELEITESVMLRDTEATLATMHQLRELGVQIAMDDFGTGYSSLSYLRRFPFDRIKIDQSFVSELGLRDDCMAIVRAVVALGRDLGMAITAEGVETRQQLATLERAGCDEIQGFLFSRPVPEAALIELLRSMPVIADVWPPSDARARSMAVEVKEPEPV